MRAVILASLALGSYRNARRAGLTLVDTYHHIDQAVRGHDRAGLITAVLAEIDQRTGLLRVISAGHPSRIVLRAGQVVKVLSTPTALPVALGDKRPPVVVEEALEGSGVPAVPGDGDQAGAVRDDVHAPGQASRPLVHEVHRREPARRVRGVARGDGCRRGEGAGPGQDVRVGPAWRQGQSVRVPQIPEVCSAVRDHDPGRTDEPGFECP
ncbi:SpoIIE family protein phosphatase [Actinoplanes sp. NPDC049596]|uniref:SpoIIE family protein phosphatase n=1 Tax=unclassified Actinoplanes TaxID=2626549 RepID=UPI003442B254